MSLLNSTSPEVDLDGAGTIEDSLDLDSNDGFNDDDDDNISFDGVYDDDPHPHPEYDDYGYDEFGQEAAYPQAMEEAPARPYYPNTKMCIVCQVKPPYNRNGKSYPTCGLTCAGVLEQALSTVTPTPGSIGRGYGGNRGRPSSIASSSSGSYRRQSSTSPAAVNPNIRHLAQHLGGHSPTRQRSPGFQLPPGGGQNASASGSRSPPQHPVFRSAYRSSRGGSAGQTMTPPRPQPRVAPPAPLTDPCVVCRKKPCYDKKYVTCGLTCAEKLAKSGADPAMCEYCHRKPKETGYSHCGNTCRNAAKVACLLCKSRPKFKHYVLCGKTCKKISTKQTPLILEAPADHATYDMVIKKFDAAWKYGTKPVIKKIFKIIESKTFLLPYDKYKKKVGNEVFRYHGTSRKCTLGSGTNTMLCNDSTCALCSILKSSFKTELANPSGAFGAGVYTSSAANKAYSYSANGRGAMLLTKVILGTPYPVTAFGAVSSCPAGYHSVVFDRNNGSLNETIVYSNDAIRPVFLIMFN